MPGARIAIMDYGIGNLRSVERALSAAGAHAHLTGDAAEIAAADGVVLPGVGAFGACLDALDAHGLRDAALAAAASGRPLLGVCVGFQLLFSHSEESGGRTGLGILPGRIARIGPGRGKVPHMGWNTLRVHGTAPLLEGVPDGAWVYFVHSYQAVEVPVADVVADVDYVGGVPAVVVHGSVMATQFHPEKSGSHGLQIYRNFAALCGAPVPG